MKTYNFKQFDAVFEAENDEQAKQLMQSFSTMLNKNKDNLDGLLTIASHINNESSQFKLAKKFITSTVKTKKK